MFRCRECDKITRPREKMSKKVTKRRPKIYYRNAQVIGEGWEIVQEVSLCQICGEK